MVQPIEIIEQSRVLDRYHRLVGKRLDQLDLPIREKSDFPTVQNNSTDRVSVPQHWHSESRPDSESLLYCGVGVIRLHCNVRNMNHVALENGAPHNRTGIWPQRKHLIYGVDPCLIEIVVGHETDHLSVKAEYDPVRSSAQMHRVVGDRLKNRPNVRRRSAYDDAQHFRSRRLLL